jgi:hypothetical protein
MARVVEHLHECSACSDLLEEIRSVVASCQSFPSYEPDLEMVERILLRTSGRPRTRSWRELLESYLVRPLLTPRFAVGAGLAVLFLALVLNLMAPKFPSIASALSPTEIFRSMDRGVQEIYGGGLKLYDKKNEWQAQFNYLKDRVFYRLGIMIETMDVPDEATKDPGEGEKEQQKGSSQKSSLRYRRS